MNKAGVAVSTASRIAISRIAMNRIAINIIAIIIIIIIIIIDRIAIINGLVNKAPAPADPCGGVVFMEEWRDTRPPDLTIGLVSRPAFRGRLSSAGPGAGAGGLGMVERRPGPWALFLPRTSSELEVRDACASPPRPPPRVPGALAAGAGRAGILTGGSWG